MNAISPNEFERLLGRSKNREKLAQVYEALYSRVAGLETRILQLRAEVLRLTPEATTPSDVEPPDSHGQEGNMTTTKQPERYIADEIRDLNAELADIGPGWTAAACDQFVVRATRAGTVLHEQAASSPEQLIEAVRSREATLGNTIDTPAK